MKGFKVTKKRIVANVEVNLDARDWQLFIGMGRLAEKAADALNAAAVAALAEPSREAAWSLMMPVMDSYADCGAADTEPRTVFSEMLDEVYGREFYSGW